MGKWSTNAKIAAFAVEVRSLSGIKSQSMNYGILSQFPAQVKSSTSSGLLSIAFLGQFL
jgi:hypothetical protein